jgi:hypothetical protein
MDIVIWVLVIILVIINIIFILYICFKDTNYGKDIIDNNLRIDKIYHVSANKQNLLGYLNLINPNQYDFISLVNLSMKTDEFNYISGISDKLPAYVKFAGAGLVNNNPATTVTTDFQQFIQGFTEIKHLSNFNAVSLKHSIPISKYFYYFDKKRTDIQAYARIFLRLADNVQYMFCQINILSKDEHTSYSNLKSLLVVINQDNSLPKIIVGNFNVHGHEMVFKDVYQNQYHICPLYKTLTVNNDTDGYSAYDGLVVSKDLYKRIEYKIDFSLSDIDRYVLTANMYHIGVSGTYDFSDYKFKNYVKYLKNNNNVKNNIESTGTYNPAKIPEVEIDFSNNELTAADTNNYVVYSNANLNNRLHTIEVMNSSAAPPASK